MSFLYRFGLTITRRQPYLDWANSFDDGGPRLAEDLARDRRTIYLVRESETEPELRKLLEEFWEQIFEQELAAWMEDDGTWPSARTREMFDAWFEAEVTDAVYDLTPEEPLTQAEVEMNDLDYVTGHCAWCGLEVEDDEQREAAFKLPDRARFASRQGLVLSVGTVGDRIIMGLMSVDDSESAKAGDDFVVFACSSRCEKALRKVVPRALREMRA
jgi:hypothetical protein